jgi:hypothetical protein
MLNSDEKYCSLLLVGRKACHFMAAVLAVEGAISTELRNVS